MGAILQAAAETPRLAPISPRSSTRCVPRMDAVSAGQQLDPRTLGGDGDVEGVSLVRRSGGGAQSVIEGAHEEATRLQMADTRNRVW